MSLKADGFAVVALIYLPWCLPKFQRGRDERRKHKKLILVSNMLLKSWARNSNTKRLDHWQPSFLEYGRGSLSISRVTRKPRSKQQLNHTVSKLLPGHCTHMLPDVSESNPDTKAENISHTLASTRRRSLRGSSNGKNKNQGKVKGEEVLSS